MLMLYVAMTSYPVDNVNFAYLEWIWHEKQTWGGNSCHIVDNHSQFFDVNL